MANIFKNRLDPELESTGKWVRYEDDIELLIASTGGPRFQKALKRALKRRGRAKFANDDDEESFYTSLVARECLLDWRNVTDEGGDPIPYSPEQARTFLSDPTLRPFRDFVLSVAGDPSEFTARAAREIAEEREGNSVSASAGPSSGDPTPND